MRGIFVDIAALLLLTLMVSCAPRAGGGLEEGSFEARLNGFRIHYEVHGGGPVCMVMPVSWGMSHEGMRRFLKGLEANLTMVYFDPRGLGRSQDVREESDRSMAAVRDDFDALRRHLGLEKVILLGWSNSGFNAVNYAAANPEAVSHLLLLHTFHEMKPEWMDYSKTSAERMRELMTPDKTDEDLDGMMRLRMTEQWPPAMLYDVERVKDQYLEIVASADLSWRHYLYLNETDVPGLGAPPDVGRLKMPVIIFSGRHDELPTEEMEEMHRAIRGSKFIVLEHSAHFGPIEEPEAFLAAVREFLGL